MKCGYSKAVACHTPSEVFYLTYCLAKDLRKYQDKCCCMDLSQYSHNDLCQDLDSYLSLGRRR